MTTVSRDQFKKSRNVKDSAWVWKPCNRDYFTGSEIITKPKIYVVLHTVHAVVE